MPPVIVARAETEEDIEAIRALCLEWVEWQLRVFPELKDRILTKFEPVAYAEKLRAYVYFMERRI